MNCGCPLWSVLNQGGEVLLRVGFTHSGLQIPVIQRLSQGPLCGKANVSQVALIYVTASQHLIVLSADCLLSRSPPRDTIARTKRKVLFGITASPYLKHGIFADLDRLAMVACHMGQPVSVQGRER